MLHCPAVVFLDWLLSTTSSEKTQSNFFAGKLFYVYHHHHHHDHHHHGHHHNNNTDAEVQEFKNEIKTRIRKIKEKFVITEQPESESEDEETFVGFESEGEPVMLNECKVIVEDLLCDTQERSNIYNEDQNNINKDDKFIAKNVEKINKLKEDILNKLSNIRHT